MTARPGAGRRVVVIGGGIAGLASAALLARQGYEVDLLEQHDAVGGRAGSWEAEGYRFDTGPSWYLMPEVFDHFFALLGTSTAEQLDLTLLEPGYRVFFEGRPGGSPDSDRPAPVDIHPDRARNVATFEAIEPGAGAALDAYLSTAKDAYDLAVRRFLYTSFESLATLLRADVVRRAPRLVSLLTRTLDRHVARSFDDPRLRQILGYPAVFLGSSPDRAPSMYHLMSHLDLADGVRYPQGGFARLIEVIADLARAEGVRIHLGAEATAITTTAQVRHPDHPHPHPAASSGAFCDRHAGVSSQNAPLDRGSRGLDSSGPGGSRARGLRRRSRARVTGVTYRDPAGTLRSLDADVVVGATDLHHLETELVAPELRTYPQSWWDTRDPGPGAVLVYLGVEGRIPQLPHHSLFFTADWQQNFDDVFGSDRRVPDPASTYVCKPSATDPTVAPDGAENVFILVPVPADVSIGRGGVDGRGDPDVEKAADAAIDQLATWAGIPDLRSRIVVRRTVGPGDFAADLHAWSGGALGPAHTWRQSAFLRGRNASRRIDGLFYAGGSTIPGIGLPMCLISAEVLVKRLGSDRSTEPLAAPL